MDGNGIASGGTGIRALCRPTCKNAALEELGAAFVYLPLVLKDFRGQEQETMSEVVVGVVPVDDRAISDRDPKLQAVPDRKCQDVRQLPGTLLRRGYDGPVAGKPVLPLLGATVALDHFALADMAFKHSAVQNVFGLEDIEVAKIVTVAHID